MGILNTIQSISDACLSIIDVGIKGIEIELNGWNKEGRTPLTIAAEKNALDDAKELLHKGADVNASSSNKVSPLMYACHCNNTEMAELLVKAGANVNAKDKDGWTPLIFTSFTGNLKVVKMLVDCGADLKAKTIDGYTALSASKSNSRGDSIALLLEAHLEHQQIVHDVLKTSHDDDNVNSENPIYQAPKAPRKFI